MKANRTPGTCVVALLCGLALMCFAAEDDAPADAAWKEVLKGLRPPPPPAEWRTNQPTKEQIAAYERQNGELAGQAADKAKSFYTKFPDHIKAKEAQTIELQLLSVAVQLGETNREAQLGALQESRLNDPALSEDEKFNLRAQKIAKMLIAQDSTNRETILATAEKAVQTLQQEFPKRNETYELLLMVAQGYLESGNIEKARAVVENVIKSASGDAKEQAQASLRKLNRLGNRLEFDFTGLSGKQISFKNYSGKVVLVDFWATWCVPCRAALPELKEIHAKYRSRGFEIVGVSFDKDKGVLEKFIADENIAWPQYFDGLGWENKMGQEFEINSIPTVWLVDKKGNLRDLNGRQSLDAKIERLLSEN